MTNLEALKALHRIEHAILDVDQAIDLLQLTEGSTMLDATVAATIKKLDDATTAVGTRLAALIDQANKAGSLSAAEVNAALKPEVDRLTAMAADPNNPVP